MNKKLKILLLSSQSPYQSANLGLDVITSLEQAGHDVDFITRYKFDNMLSNMYSVYDYYEPKSNLSLRYRLKKKYPFLKHLNPYNFFRKRIDKKYDILNKAEDVPPISSGLILNKIKKEYDFVMTLFLHYMITTVTLRDIYHKLKCPIFIYAVDMYPLTGGCHYFWDCRRFLNSCGKCPGLYSDQVKDQTYKNLRLKKEIYSSIEHVYIGNTWMCNWARKSSLLRSSRVERVGLVINENTFLNRDKRDAKVLLELDPAKKFIMFAGASNMTGDRKGGDILVKSVNDFSSRLSERERREVLLILAGNKIDDLQSYFHVEVLNIGYLNVNKLALAYAAADVYLSTTVEDAGPSMVNQALMCGTPVVAFEIGIALDLVVTGQTGYCAKYKDTGDYSKGIESVYRLNACDKVSMYEKCREVALQESSFASFAHRIEQIWEGCLLNC